MVNTVTATGGNQHVHLATSIAGERNEDSATNGYLVVRDECNATVLSAFTTIAISAGVPAHLVGVYINVATAVAVIDIRDGGAAGTVIFSLPIGAPVAGTFIDFKGARFNTDLHVLETGGTATGTITLLWRPI